MNNTYFAHEEPTDAAKPLEPPSRREGIVWCAVFGTEGVIIVLGNAMAIAVFSRTRQLRRRSFYLVMNLVAADLLVGVLAIPCWIYALGSIFRLWGTRDSSSLFLEIAFPIIDMISSFASISSLATLSLERLHATFRPLRHRVLRKRLYFVSIVSMWTFVMFPIPLRLLIHYGLIQSTVAFVWLPLQLVLLLEICAAYTAIWIKLRFGQNHGHPRSTQRDRKLTMALFVVAILSLFVWLPFMVFNIIYYFAPALYRPRALYSIKLLHYGNSMINPVIYPFRMPVFRRASARLLCLGSPEVRPHTRPIPLSGMALGTNSGSDDWGQLAESPQVMTSRKMGWRKTDLFYHQLYMSKRTYMKNIYTKQLLKVYKEAMN